jgi:4-aminobutyrate aminotransferase/(S)-3-amino-2-methylpropionate transaminase
MGEIRLITDIPGPKSLEMVRRREASSARGAAKLTDIGVATAEGALVTDVDGNQLLDFAGGIGMMAVGHRPEAITRALHEQVDRLLHLSAIVGTFEPYVRLCELLCEVAPIAGPTKAVLLNSGAEAVETAVKIARSHTGRQAIVVFEGGYHGRTNLTLAMTSKYGLFKRGFGPFAPEIYRIPFPNLYRRPAGVDEDAWVAECVKQLDHAMVAQVAPEAVAAVVVEPVQGEGGFLPIPPAFFRRLREICSAHGIVLVADEIQSGMGRTGRWLASEHEGVDADVTTLAKALGNGVPVGACLSRGPAADVFQPGTHGSTFGGNALACRAARTVLHTIQDDDLLARNATLGQRMLTRLRKRLDTLDGVEDIRGRGLMMGIQLSRPCSDLVGRALERGVLVNVTAERVVRLLPPYILTDEQADQIGDTVSELVEEHCTTQAGTAST